MHAPHRVLITGGLGFQGLHLALALLAQGRQVTVLNTPSPRARGALLPVFESQATREDAVVWGSVTDQEVLEKVIPAHDAVVHMAAWASVDQSLDRPWPPWEVNGQGTMCVLEAVRRFNPQARVVVASSCEVYGPAGKRQWARSADYLTGAPPVAKRMAIHLNEFHPQDENAPMLPRSPYAASKIAGDRMAYAYAVTYDLDVTILRPCNVFGPWQRVGGFGAVIPTFVLRALEGQPLQITGGGLQSREFLYVDDVVRAYQAVLDRDQRAPGAVYNCGSDHLVTIRALAEQVVAAISPACPIQNSGARVADVSGFRLDSGKIKRALGWEAVIPFDEGLQRYIGWAKQSGAAAAWR